MLLNDLPNVMIVHLKRIIFDLEVLMNLKINTRYAFPQELNLKEFSLQKYEEDQAELDKNKTQEELDEYEKAMEEYRANNENRKELEEEQKNFIKATHYEDEHFEYQLKGIVIHRGTAEFGHYYSFINVNRKDPAHPEYTQDQWMEFNDSSIRKFNVNNLEEETFGSGNTIERDDDFGFGMMANFGKMASNKNAYVLVYEKKTKVPIKFTFNEDNLKEKDTILKNLIDKEQREKALFKETEDPEDPIKASLEVPYFSIQKHVPSHLNTEIREDNFQFMLEQHVYSKEFLNFVTGICNFPDIPDFKPNELEDKLYKGEVPGSTKAVLSKVLEMQLNLYMDIVSRTSDNEGPQIFASNMMKIISICPEISYSIFKKYVFNQPEKIISLIVGCQEQKVRFSTVCLITHLMIVVINHFKVDMSEELPVLAENVSLSVHCNFNPNRDPTHLKRLKS